MRRIFGSDIRKMIWGIINDYSTQGTFSAIWVFENVARKAHLHAEIYLI